MALPGSCRHTVLAALLPGHADRANRRSARRLGVGPALAHEVTVPPGPGDRPGERLTAPSRSEHRPRLTPDGCREDLTVMLGRGGSTLRVVCLAPATEGDRPWPASWATVLQLHAMGYVCSQEPAFTTIAGEQAVTYAFAWPSGGRLTEWKLDRHGWLFVVGILEQPGDPDARRLGEETLASWHWLEPSPASSEGRRAR